MVDQIADSYGVPCYYVDTAVPEDAGNGLVRVWNCATRNGVLVPQVEIIIQSTRLIMAGRRVTDFAQKAFNAGQMMLPGMHH